MKEKLSPYAIRIAIFLGLALVAAFSISEFALKQDSSEPINQRGPASVKGPPVKTQKTLPKGNPHFHSGKTRELPVKHTEKLLAPVVVQLTADGELPSGSGDSFGLKAQIKSRYDIDVLQVEWILPSGVTLQSGALQDTLYNVKAGTVYEVTGLFLQSSDDNEQVHFRVKSPASNLPFATTAQFNTVAQEDIDESVAALEKRAREHMKKQKAKMVK